MVHPKSSRGSASAAFLLVLLALVLGLGAWLTLGRGQSGAGDSGPLALAPGEPTPVVPEVAPSLEAEDRGVREGQPLVGEGAPQPELTETTVIHPLEVELSLIQAARLDIPRDMLPQGSGARARIRGRVHSARDAGGALLGKGSATVHFTAGPNTGRILTCDAHGNFGASDLYPGLGIVRIDTPEGWSAEREVRLANLSEESLNVAFGRPAAVYGTVLDLKGEPVIGAQVRLDGRESTTDQDGKFGFPKVSPGHDVLALIRAEGYALHQQKVPVRHGAVITADQLVFRLEPEALTEIKIEDRLGALQPAKVYVLPAGGVRGTGSRGSNVFPWHELNPIEVHPGSSVVVHGLPERTLSFSLFHSGALASPRTINKKLEGGRENRVVLHLEPGPVVRGVVQLEGKPLPGATVRLEAPDRGVSSTKSLGRRPTYLQETILPILPAGLQEVSSDNRGRFVFTAYADMDARYYLAAEARGGALHARALVQAGAENVILELEQRDERAAALQLHMGGRSQGLPVEIRVQGAPRGNSILPADQPLLIEGLTPGDWRLEARWHGQPVLEPRTVRLNAERTLEVPAVLPRGATEGQTPEERSRAGH